MPHLQRERLIVAGSIALLVAFSWWFLATGAGMPPAMGMPGMQPPLLALVVMWWLMMVAMMLPSAAPAVVLYVRVREQTGPAGAVVRPWIFVSGYLAVWLLFSLGAAVMQRLLATPAMTLEDSALKAALLITAGLYQLSPVKNACLRQCRSPARFLHLHWRPGGAGALRLGVLHGAYCVGCCWMLMALLFVGGIMNFAWIAVLAVLVAIEKLVAKGEWVGRAAGAALIGWGMLKFAGY